MPLIRRPTNSESIPPSISFYETFIVQDSTPAPITTGPGTRQLGPTTPVTQSLLKLCKLSNHKIVPLAYLAPSSPFLENHTEGPCPQSLLSLPAHLALQSRCCVAEHVCHAACFQATVNIKKELLPSWQAWPWGLCVILYLLKSNPSNFLENRS